MHHPTLQNRLPSSAIPHPIETAILSAGLGGINTIHMNQIYGAGGGGANSLVPPPSAHHIHHQHHHHHHHHHPKSHAKSGNNH